MVAASCLMTIPILRIRRSHSYNFQYFLLGNDRAGGRYGQVRRVGR